jgi:hypothetical protein
MALGSYDLHESFTPPANTGSHGQRARRTVPVPAPAAPGARPPERPRRNRVEAARVARGDRAAWRASPLWCPTAAIGDGIASIQDKGSVVAADKRPDPIQPCR